MQPYNSEKENHMKSKTLETSLEPDAVQTSTFKKS